MLPSPTHNLNDIIVDDVIELTSTQLRPGIQLAVVLVATPARCHTIVRRMEMPLITIHYLLHAAFQLLE